MLPSTRRHGRRPTHRAGHRAARAAPAHDGARHRSEVSRRARTNAPSSSSRAGAATSEASRWSFVAPIAMVSMLFGASTAMVIAGLYSRLDTIFGGLAREPVLAGAFLGMAVGVRVPQRLTMWACTLVWESVVSRGRRTNVTAILTVRGSADRPLYWIVLSGIALLAGVTIALLPVALVIVSAFYAWLHAHFVWSAMPLDMLHVVLAFGVGLVPMFTLGLALSCTHHMSCPLGRWDIRAMGWHLLGASVGTLIYSQSVRLDVSTRALLVASSIPALFVALLAAGAFSQYREHRPLNMDDADTLPMRSDRRPTLLRAGIVAVGGGAAVCLLIACRLVVTAYDLSPTAVAGVVPIALMGMGMGVLLGCRSRPPGTRTLRGFGISVITSGGAAMVASLMLARSTRWGMWGAALCCGIMLIAIGFTTGYGWQLLMASVASRSSEGSKMTARLLICVALAVGILVPITRVAGIEAGAMAVVAMWLVALGGCLVVCDPLGVTWKDRARHAQ